MPEHQLKGQPVKMILLQAFYVEEEAEGKLKQRRFWDDNGCFPGRDNRVPSQAPASLKAAGRSRRSLTLTLSLGTHSAMERKEIME